MESPKWSFLVVLGVISSKLSKLKPTLLNSDIKHFIGFLITLIITHETGNE